jgi:hypothetical protein
LATDYLCFHEWRLPFIPTQKPHGEPAI